MFRKTEDTCIYLHISRKGSYLFLISVYAKANTTSQGFAINVAIINKKKWVARRVG